MAALSSVVLSNGYTFDLVANGYSEGSNSVSVTFIPGEVTLETLETEWTGNDNIKIVLNNGEETEVIRNFAGYTVVESLIKNNKYESGVDEETGEVTYITVVTVKCAKPSVEARVANVEDAVDDIIDTLLG